MIWLPLLVRKVRTVFQIAPADRKLLFQALCLLPLVAVLLPLGGLKTAQALLSRLPQQSSEPKDSEESRLLRTVRMVRIASRYGRPWTNCLKQSLVLWALLRVQGISTDLKIGVKRELNQLYAHAWVEWQTIVLNDGEDVHERFRAFEHRFT